MNIKIEYSNKTPTFYKEIPEVGRARQPIINLVVEGEKNKKNVGDIKERSRKASLSDVLLNLEHLFRDLRNMYDTDIKVLELDLGAKGTLIKSGNDVKINVQGESNVSKYDKYNMIVYNFESDIFREKLLFTRNGSITRNGSALRFGNNLVNEDILSIEGRQNNPLFINVFMTVLNRYLPNYKLKIDNETKHLYYAYKGSRINNIEDIKEDDEFLFFKFIEVWLTKGTHSGVFFIDSRIFKANVLQALLNFITFMYQTEGFVFLYGPKSETDEKLKGFGLPVSVVTLPNHKILDSVELDKNNKN